MVFNSYFANILPRLNNRTSELPKKKINLDLPVKERYREILIEFKNKVKAHVQYNLNVPYGFVVGKIGRYLLNKSKQDPEWFEYIQAVSEFCDIPLNHAVMLSVFYEYSCTTTIIQDSQNQIFMGRNLDFDSYYIMAHLMIDAEYYKNGVLVYKGIEFVGTSGILNAVKPGKFAISINQRYSHYTAAGNLLRAYNGRFTPSFAVAKVMEMAENFVDAFNLLSKIQMTAPIFFTVTGMEKNQGAIIARDIDTVYKVDKLDVDNGIWFLVISNTDTDKVESEDDFRRVPTEDHLKTVGRQNINYETLNSVMSDYPTNNILTVYVTIQSPSGYFSTTLWLP